MHIYAHKNYLISQCISYLTNQTLPYLLVKQYLTQNKSSVNALFDYLQTFINGLLLTQSCPCRSKGQSCLSTLSALCGKGSPMILGPHERSHMLFQMCSCYNIHYILIFCLSGFKESRQRFLNKIYPLNILLHILFYAKPVHFYLSNSFVGGCRHVNIAKFGNSTQKW